MFWSPTTILSLVTAIYILAYIVNKTRQKRRARLLQRAEDELHPILKDNTTFRSYTTTHATYPRIRTFYHPHSHKDKHPEIQNLPLFVIIHGLGGVLPQFAPLLGSLKNIAPCFGLELPGHGRSSFAPKDYDAYTLEAFAELWRAAIEDVCKATGHKELVLIGHSMGCSIAALLSSDSSPISTLSIPVIGLVAICPRGNTIPTTKAKSYRRLLSLPDPVINLIRWFDRRGGEYSKSVTRIVGNTDEFDLRSIQLGWNRQFRTPVWKRSTVGLLPRHGKIGSQIGGCPGEEVWRGINLPLFLVAGNSDRVTLATEVEDIFHYTTGQTVADAERQQLEEETAQHVSASLRPTTLKLPEPQGVVQAIVLAAPAAHALLYAHSTYRLVAALIETFLAAYVSERLDFGYQLRLLTTTGKWDVKNLEKWKAVLPVSAPIAVNSTTGPNGLFRALKTMRQQDGDHNPTIFLQKWAHKIYAVIDISHDAPVYNTKLLDQGGIEYHKFPTVSKIPPTPIEVQDFCSLVDKLAAEQNAKASGEHDGNSANVEKRAIAVHCHYGYNRTGFFICAYLILRMQFSVQDAIDEFKRAKPPGIRHEHFLDMLWLRYSNANSTGTGDRRKSVSTSETEKDRRGKQIAKPGFAMTKRKESNTEMSAVSRQRSLALPFTDIDIGSISEGDLM